MTDFKLDEKICKSERSGGFIWEQHVKEKIQNVQRRLKEEIMKTEKEDDGEFSKNKICACGSHKLSHDPHFIDDEEVCNIIVKVFLEEFGGKLT